MSQHFQKGCTSTHGRLLEFAIRKYGANSIIGEVLASCSSRVHACSVERFFIWQFKTQNTQFGYNLTSGGDGKPNVAVSEATKTKISVSQKKRLSSVVVRKHISNCMKRNWNKNPEKYVKVGSVTTAHLQELWRDPVYRDRMSLISKVSRKEFFSDPKNCEKSKELAKKQWSDPVIRARMITARRARTDSQVRGPSGHFVSSES